MYRLNVYRTWHIEATPQHPFIHFHTFMNWQLVACLHIYKDTKRNERTSTTPTPQTKPNQTRREKIKIFDDNYRGFVNVFVDYFDLYTSILWAKSSHTKWIHRDRERNHQFSLVFFGCYCWFLLDDRNTVNRNFMLTPNTVNELLLLVCFGLFLVSDFWFSLFVWFLGEQPGREGSKEGKQ